MSYDSKLAQTMADIDDVLRESSALLGVDNTPGAGKTSGSLATEERGDHSDDHSRPSTAHQVRVGAGKGKERADEPSALGDVVSPHVDNTDTDGLRPKENTVAVSDAQLSTPVIKENPLSFGDQDGTKDISAQRVRPVGYSSHRWSEWEDNGDPGPVPRFDVDSNDQHSTDEIDFVNYNSRKRLEDQARHIRELEQQIRTRDAQIATLHGSLEEQQLMLEEVDQMVRNSVIPQAAPLPEAPAFNCASSTLLTSSLIRRAMTGGDDSKGLMEPLGNIGPRDGIGNTGNNVTIIPDVGLGPNIFD